MSGNPQSVNIEEILLINAFFSVDLIMDNMKNIKIQKKIEKYKKNKKSVNSLLGIQVKISTE